MNTEGNIDFITPPFLAHDISGNEVNLADYTDGYTLLVFLRYSGCPWCNLAIHRLSMEYNRLKADDCRIVAVVQSDKQAIIENIYDRHEPLPQFPIIADREMRLYKQFGVDASLTVVATMVHDIPHWLHSVNKLGFSQKKIDGNFFLVPAWFLINNKSDTIVRSERGASFYDHESFTGIYDSLTFKD